jgi:hypothetical protein
LTEPLLRRTQRPAQNDPMREMDLLLLEELTMHHSLNSHLDIPARSRAVQTVGLLLVLACWGVVFVYSLIRSPTIVAAAAQQAEIVEPASGIVGQFSGVP